MSRIKCISILTALFVVAATAGFVTYFLLQAQVVDVPAAVYDDVERGGDAGVGGIAGGDGGDDGGGPIFVSEGDVIGEVDTDADMSALDLEEECVCMPSGGESQAPEEDPVLQMPSEPTGMDGWTSSVAALLLRQARSAFGGGRVSAKVTSCGVGFTLLCTPGGSATGPVRKDHIIQYSPSDPVELDTTGSTLEEKVEQFCHGTIGGDPVPLPGPSTLDGAMAVTQYSLKGKPSFQILIGAMIDGDGNERYFLSDGQIDDISTPEEDFAPHPAIYPTAKTPLLGKTEVYVYKIPGGLTAEEWGKLKRIQDTYLRHEAVHVRHVSELFAEVEMLIDSPAVSSGLPHGEHDSIIVHEGPYTAYPASPVRSHVKADYDKAVGAAVERLKRATKAFHDCIALGNFPDADDDTPLTVYVRNIPCMNGEVQDAILDRCERELGSP